MASLIGCCAVLNFCAKVTTNQSHYWNVHEATSSVCKFKVRIKDVSVVETLNLPGKDTVC